MDIILLDQAKAFDKLQRNLLLLKVNAYGVHVELIARIEAFLTNRTKKVLMKTEHGTIFSESAIVHSDVPQGTILGPTLIRMYVNDCSTNLNTHLMSYADDCKPLGLARCNENPSTF